MLKKISVWFLCALCLLTAATWALADEEPTASDVELPPISDVEEPSTEDSEPPVESETPTELSVFISPVFSDTALLLTVTDELGQPVPNVPLSFDVDTTVKMTSTFTGADGTASLSIVGIAPGTEIVCHSVEIYTGSVTYRSATVAVVVPGDVTTTTTATATTVTTEPTTTATTEPTTTATAAVVTTMAPLPTLPSTESTGTTRSTPSYAELHGATTTHVQGNSVYTNLLIDEHLLEQFGYSIERFDGVGRLTLDKDTYTSLTDTYGSHLFGKLTSSALSDVTADQIRTAQKGVADFADCKPENAMALTFAVSLQFMEDNGNGLPVTDASSLGSDLMFEFSLPVPKSMEKCQSFGIAMTGENLLNPLTPALGHFTLVGFTDGTPATGGSPLGAIMWVLIGLGVLMFALMGFLIYRFFIRDRGEDPDDDPDDPYDDGEDDWNVENGGEEGEADPSGEAGEDDEPIPQ